MRLVSLWEKEEGQQRLREGEWGWGRDWNERAISQGTPKIANNYQKLEERHGIDYPSRRNQPANNLILDSGLLNCQRISFCHVKPPSLWCSVTAALETDKWALPSGLDQPFWRTCQNSESRCMNRAGKERGGQLRMSVVDTSLLFKQKFSFLKSPF